MIHQSPCKNDQLSTDAPLFRFFGAHPREDGVVFRLLAPGAEQISVCGDFNGWDVLRHPMQQALRDGVWELYLKQKGLLGSRYKFFVQGKGGGAFKSDPFGFEEENNENGASVITNLWEYPWRDGGWMQYRKQQDLKEAMLIYRVDARWWRRHGDGSPYNYGELASELIPYAKQMGYTHVALFGVAGGLCDALGTPDALYAPGPRLGKPWELMALVDSMHEAGLGVIFGWCPTSFLACEHGLGALDDTPFYEKSAAGIKRAFDLQRAEVRDYLIANAEFWVTQYHVDGLWIDGASADPDEADFWRTLQEIFKDGYPDVMLLSGTASIRSTLMGSEFGDPWTTGCERPLAWELLSQNMHAAKQLCEAEQNHSYLSRTRRAQ